MKKILFTLALLVSFSFDNQTNNITAKKNKIIKLSNGESVKIKDIRGNIPLLLGNNISINSAVISSFKTDKIDSNDLLSYVNLISSNLFGYYSITPSKGSYTVISSSMIWSIIDKHGGQWYHGYTDEFKEYYRKIFKNQTAREILFKFTLNLLVNACERWPKDFTSAVLSQIDELIEKTPKLQKLSVSALSKLLSGKAELDINYIDGFIYRRIKLDNVPINEVLGYLKTTKEKLQEINIDQLPDVMNAININNHIVLYEGVNFNQMLYSKLNSKTLIFNSLSNEAIIEIKFLTGNDGDFYQIKNQIKETHLYDKYLNKIY
tara:strand:- start:157 stop:1116 length:960 start_codon:yes stop_codon:yes gene_type:complete